MNAREIIFKILVIGDTQVGKTTFIRRYVDASYDKNYKATVGGILVVLFRRISISSV